MRLALLAACVLLSLRAHGAQNPYQVLGIGKQASAAQVKRAYKRAALQLHPDKNPSRAATARFLDVQAAYELLSDADRRGRYDSTGDDQEQPRWQAQEQRPPFYRSSWGAWSAHIASATPLLDRRSIVTEVLNSDVAWLIELYADGSAACHAAAPHWEKAAQDLQGVVRLGRVAHAADPVLSMQLASAGRSLGLRVHVAAADLPLVVGFPPDCAHMSCACPFWGPLQPDALAQFAADTLLALPQVQAVPAASIESFVTRAPTHMAVMVALARSPHASAALRKVAADFAGSIATGSVWVRPQELEALEARFAIRKLPALLFFLGPGTQPVLKEAGRDGRTLNVSRLARQHQWPLVAQLRRDNADALGCSWGLGVDHAGQMRACAVLIGRGSMERGRARMAQLAESLAQPKALPSAAAAAGKAFQASALRIVWLNTDQQRAFCRYHVGHMGRATVRAVCGETSYWAAALARLHWWRATQTAVVVFQPGGVKLSPWWNLPHRWAVLPGAAVTEASTHEVATWLAGYLDGRLADVQEGAQVPPPLESDGHWAWLQQKAEAWFESVRRSAARATHAKAVLQLLHLAAGALAHEAALPLLLLAALASRLRGGRADRLLVGLTLLAALARRLLA